MTKGKSRDAAAEAIAYVRLHARRDPRFAKGPDKARIIEARDIVAALDSRAGDAMERWKGERPIAAAYDDNRHYQVAMAAWEKRRPPAVDAVPADDVQAKLDQYRTAWEALFGPLSWMQYSDQLTTYAGWGLSEIANDLIDRAYPGLRSSAVAAKEARAHG